MRRTKILKASKYCLKRDETSKAFQSERKTRIKMDETISGYHKIMGLENNTWCHALCHFEGKVVNGI